MSEKEEEIHPFVIFAIYLVTVLILVTPLALISTITVSLGFFAILMVPLLIYFVTNETLSAEEPEPQKN
jgi:hypothetical protein